MTDGNYEGSTNTTGRPHGVGVFTWSGGVVYEGEFKHGAITGKGTYRWSDGSVYEGEFVNSARSGRGTFVYVNGDVYQGEYKDDKMSGQGIMWFANGNRYSGSWFKGKKNGQGILYDAASQSYYDCTFDNGNPKSGCWVTQGNLYKGPFVNGAFGGRGIYTYPSGNSKQGNFTDGVLDESTSKVLPNHVPTWSVPADFYRVVPEPVDILPQNARNPPPIPEPILPPGTTFVEGRKTSQMELPKIDASAFSPRSPMSPKSPKQSSSDLPLSPKTIPRAPPSDLPLSPKPIPRAPPSDSPLSPKPIPRSPPTPHDRAGYTVNSGDEDESTQGKPTLAPGLLGELGTALANRHNV